jgi:hypothetical protein
MKKIINKKIQEVKVHEINSLTNFDNVGKLVSLINKFWKIDVKPNGYDELKKDYQDFDGMEEFDPTEMLKFFKGFDSESASSLSFPEQLSAPQILYGECCQGRSPLHSLVSAVFSYAFQCGAKYQELKYVDSFESTLELQEKLNELPEAETPENQIKELKREIGYLVRDIKHKLYFDSVVTDYSKLDKICPKEM